MEILLEHHNHTQVPFLCLRATNTFSVDSNKTLCIMSLPTTVKPYQGSPTFLRSTSTDYSKFHVNLNKNYNNNSNNNYSDFSVSEVII